MAYKGDSRKLSNDQILDQHKAQSMPESEYLTPQEYFEKMKALKHKCTDASLNRVLENCIFLVKKYQITGQTTALKKLQFHMQCIEKERELVGLKVNTFIYKDDITSFIEDVADKAVKITTLAEYERDIPDRIVETIQKVKTIFDEMYVLFTDYTGQQERKVEKERRAKDPILFGVFKDSVARAVVDRFYYLGDWEDEYCDLTLDKMVNQMKVKGRRNIQHTISTPEYVNELLQQMDKLQLQQDGTMVEVLSLNDDNDK